MASYDECVQLASSLRLAFARTQNHDDEQDDSRGDRLDVFLRDFARFCEVFEFLSLGSDDLRRIARCVSRSSCRRQPQRK